METFTDKEKKEVVNSFKSYMKLVAYHSAIDYSRKIKSPKYSVVSLSEYAENEVSLSQIDSDIFVFLDKEDNIFSNVKYNNAFKKLTEKERKVLLLHSKQYNPEEISKILGITRNNVDVLKYRAIQKFKENLKKG